jgi:hypothetical protein
MEAYSYMSSGGMLLLLLILGAIITYLLFSKGFWLDRFMQDRKWEGQDIEPDYNTNQDKQSIHDAISQEKIPYTPALNIPFEDPEVPNRPSKKSKKKKKTATNRNVGPVNGRRKGKKRKKK